MSENKRLKITAGGKVQGVGFRPFIFRLALSEGLSGSVANSGAGVEIDVEGPAARLDCFLSGMRECAPKGASIRDLKIEPAPPTDRKGFKIEASTAAADFCAEVSPDIAMCPDCAREITDASDRRFFYPFASCTGCGPRFSIIFDVPYDRPLTTMDNFPMCTDCSEEYLDPADRRFHAQPNACGACGPSISIRPDGAASALDGLQALKRACSHLSSGGILAIKGLGGFHLACDAGNGPAVEELRKKKSRGRKPFALMAGDAEAVRNHCFLSAGEEALLSSPGSPAVLLRRKFREGVCPGVAGSSPVLGFMLPYTPLHFLLFQLLPAGSVLVMTSGNFSEDPIIYDDSAAAEKLSGKGCLILTHDRAIKAPCDDSVARILPVDGAAYIIRRSRGYAPEPLFLDLPRRARGVSVFAAGGDLKNTFCLAEGGRFILSQHIGDLSNPAAFELYGAMVEHYKKLFRAEPDVFACDKHPGYFSSMYAREKSPAEPAMIQHHHAHIASCMADNGLSGDRKVIGAAFDGTGCGDNGELWGGEFLVCDYSGFERAAALKGFMLPGGERAVKEPWRIAASLVYDVYGDFFYESLPPALKAVGREKLESVKTLMESGINCPASTSAGRLFDGVSALLGLCLEISYEGEAAVSLENEADTSADGNYEFSAAEEEGIISIDWSGIIRGIVGDAAAGATAGVISERFHRTMADIIVYACALIRSARGIEETALSGGVFQNMNLLEKARSGLLDRGFGVLVHKNVPANDGGLSLGQAAAASFLIGG